jgi:hypothetical protein
VREGVRYDACMKRILVSWSSGKDSAWTLHLLRQTDDYEIVGLLTTVNIEFDRVAMHGLYLKRRPKRRGCRSGQCPCLGRAPMKLTNRECARSATVR